VIKLPEEIDVIILCGGKGTRLQSVVTECPKPMASIGKRPFLEVLIERVAMRGFRKFILCTGYKQEQIISHFSNCSNLSEKCIDVVFSKEENPLGTSGAIKNAEEYLKSELFLVINGDTFCDLDFKGFVNWHNSRGAELSIALCKKPDSGDCGLVVIDSSDQVTSFNEKADATGKYVNAGVYVMNKSLLDYIPEGRAFSMEYDLIPSILHRPCFGYVTNADFLDIGTPERYMQACSLLER
jgi:D-glycero-alpha-D-manno-heptose 1-phosphate guanylyltransferase